MRCGCDGQKGQYTTIHANAAKTTQGSAKDEYVHFISGATDGRPDLEQEDTNKIQNFGIELSINLAPDLSHQCMFCTVVCVQAYQTRFVPDAATRKATDSQGSLSTWPKRSTMAG